MSADIFEVEQKRYTSQKSIQLYLTTGTASDWFYSDNANTGNEFRAAGYTIELRDTGFYGFLLPPDQVSNYYVELYCKGTRLDYFIHGFTNMDHLV